MNELDKQTPMEETNAAPTSCEREATKVEGMTSDACVETESPAEAIAEVADTIEERTEAADSIEQKADLRRYHSMTPEQLVQALRDILAADEMTAHKDVQAIKQAYFLVKEKETKSLMEKFVEEGGAPEDFEAPADAEESELKALLADFRERRAAFLEKEENERKANLESKRKILEQLRAIAEDIDNINLKFSDFRKLQQEFKAIGDVPPGTENEIWRDYQEVEDLFYDRLNMNKDLRDLDFRKNYEVKRRLCDEAKSLTEAEDRLAAFRRLQAIHAEWRETGPVAREVRESLWEEFKAASTLINRRHQEFFEARKAEEKANEEKKTALCEEAEAIDMEAIATAKGWDEATAKILDIQKRWKEVGMATRKINNELMQRFRTYCDLFFSRKSAFFTRLKEQQSQAVNRKKDLVARAEALAEEENISKAVETVKKMRGEWKESGHVSSRISDTLWERFNKACDAVFERRRALDADRHAEEDANLAAKREIIEKVKQIPLDGDRNNAITEVRALQDEWSRIGFVPFRQKEKIYQEYKQACDAVYDAYKGRERQERARNFERRVKELKGDGNKLFSERERLLRAYDQKRGQLQTYENNMGFFNVKTSAGSTMLKELERKIAHIKEEMKELEDKISVLDNEPTSKD
ncbi:MAG: DUF349 domain-containing protein [Bacteroidales bacterium]|nr:DUF349 domain-containing protein [Bacteroidales bacterium]